MLKPGQIKPVQILNITITLSVTDRIADTSGHYVIPLLCFTCPKRTWPHPKLWRWLNNNVNAFRSTACNHSLEIYELLMCCLEIYYRRNCDYYRHPNNSSSFDYAIFSSNFRFHDSSNQVTNMPPAKLADHTSTPSNESNRQNAETEVRNTSSKVAPLTETMQKRGLLIPGEVIG